VNIYLWIKTLHILSAGVLFGTGLGIAYFKWTVDRSGHVGAIRVTSEKVVIADRIFTSVAVVVQPITGIELAQIAGFPLLEGWIGYTLLLYVLIGLCWLPVVFLQIRMRDLARTADRDGMPLPDRYWRYCRMWHWLGVPAFSLLLIVYWLMVFKPG
jgi:uncharacterized membrane protein